MQVKFTGELKDLIELDVDKLKLPIKSIKVFSKDKTYAIAELKQPIKDSSFVAVLNFTTNKKFKVYED